MFIWWLNLVRLFKGIGFRIWGLDLGFRGLGFRGLGIKGFRGLGTQ